MALGLDQDHRARAVLAWALSPEPNLEWAVPLASPLSCPNCGGFVERPRSPYCSDRCREIAGWVRQVRRLQAEKGPPEPERAAILGQTLWALVGGRYPGRVAVLPARSIQRVLARYDGKCEFCPAPASTVDHIRTACNREINLRPVCDECTRTKPFGHPGLVAEAEITELKVRVHAPAPLRTCDADDWNWRELISLRKNAQA